WVVLLGSSAGINWGMGGGVFGQSTQDEDGMGSAVASARDVNGDGYSDIVVASPLYDGGLTDEGRVQGYPRGADCFWGQTAPGFIVEPNQVNAQLGTWVASAGDVNGDGYADVVVGAPRFDNGQTDEGKVLLYLGAAGGIDPLQPPAWTAEGNQADALFGLR